MLNPSLAINRPEIVSDDTLSPGMPISAGVHIVVLLIWLFGVPMLWQRHRDVENHAIVVELLPIREITNVRPQQQKPPQKPKEVEKPKLPEPKKAEPKPVKASKPVEKPAPKPVAVEKTPVKKEVVKEPPKPKEVKKPASPSLDDILNSVAKQAETSPAAAPQSETQTKSNSNYNPSLPLSISEKDAIRSQIAQNWRVPSGVRDARNLQVALRIRMNRDGSVRSVDNVDQIRYRTDGVYRAAVDSATRAVWKSSPLQRLPMDKFPTWQDIELTFDPSEMLY